LREIVLDTETTGLYYNKGDRIIEIGCLELYDHVPTGKTYQQYINPRYDIHEEATKISGLTNDFVKDFPLFEEIIDDFLAFIGDTDTLVIHNAQFDINFLNMEFEKLGKPLISMNRVVDTLKMARAKVSSARYTLDALCEKFSIDKSLRTLHGALVDCDLLAKVYLELKGGRQRTFSFHDDVEVKVAYKDQSHRSPRVFEVAADEKALHEAAMKEIKEAMW
jgi:DNA polymerase-3 subunit epsilon